MNWWYHDAAAALVDADGGVYWMAEEERFTRHRHAWGEFPVLSSGAALAHRDLRPEDVSTIAIGWQPWLVDKSENRPWPYPGAKPDALAQDLLGWPSFPKNCTVEYFDHHDAHAASAFYASPFGEAAVLVVDGHGERSSVTIYRATRDGGIERVERYSRPFSLGYFYEAATRYLGFRLLESGKTMGLASYAQAPTEPLHEFADGVPPGVKGVREDCTWDEAARAWAEWFGANYPPVTTPPADLANDPNAVALAAAAQATVEQALLYLVARSRKLTGLDAVCVAGGVAQNCVAIGLLDEPLYVPPFPHDAGVAVGAAWLLTGAAPHAGGLTPYLGDPPEPGVTEKLPGWRVAEPEPDLVAELLDQDLVGALYVGRAEVGARALGHRSIIARPDSTPVRDRINALKGREPWRPLAPSGFAECDGRYWHTQGLRARYMAGSARLTEGGMSALPGASHIDGTCRMQTVPAEGMLHGILTALERRGRPPVVLNTSFNDRGEPIVRTSSDVADAAMRMGLDFLLLDDCLLIGKGF